MTSDRSIATQTAYLTATAIQALVHRLEFRDGLTLSAESRATLYREIRPVVERVVRECLEQETVIHA